MRKSKKHDEKELIYCNRVRIGNWFEAAKLEEVNFLFVVSFCLSFKMLIRMSYSLSQYKLNQFLEQMRRGDLMLARFRTMSKNLNTPIVLTQTAGSISFGSKVSLLAPHVPSKYQPMMFKRP